MAERAPELGRDPVTHDLKIRSEHMSAIWRREKTAEIRLDDRDYRIGDTLLLREWGPRAGYSGRQIEVEITHITRLTHLIESIDHRWCVLSFRWLTGGRG